MKNLKFVLLGAITLVLLSLIPLSAQENGGEIPFGLSLNEEQGEELLSGGNLMGRMDRAPFPVNMPIHSLTASLVGNFPIDVYGDILFLKKREDNLSDQDFLLRSLNLFLSFSEQKGIQYKSDNRGLITLINDSYALNDRLRKTENIQLTELPEDLTIYAYQKDYYFSGNKFRYEVSSAEGGIRIKTTNLTDMRVKGIFKAIGRDELNMEFYILTDGEYMCLYGIALVDNIENPVEAMGLRVDIPSSMSKRMRSILEWFTLNLEEEL